MFSFGLLLNFSLNSKHEVEITHAAFYFFASVCSQAWDLTFLIGNQSRVRSSYVDMTAMRNGFGFLMLLFSGCLDLVDQEWERDQ